MRVVLCFGCFDLLHVGHLRFLRAARELGDVLVVGVASDAVIVEDKGVPPVIPLAQRVEALRALRCVDRVTPYFALEFLTTLEVLVRPDVLAVGQDWGGAPRHRDAEAWVRARGGRVATVPRTPGVSTTEIIQAVLARSAT